MRIRTLSTLLALLLVALVALPAIATAKSKKARKGGTLVVGKDADNDWGSGSVAPEAQPFGEGFGQELVEAAISKGKKKTVNFIITLKSLPPTGGTPEATRYTWNFQVDGKPLELDGKFTNFSRGSCDPTAGSCPPPRNPGLHPFVVRGNCGENDLVATTFTACEELAAVEAQFDPDKATITIPVPRKAINAKRGSKIAPGANLFGGTISAAPSAFVTSSAFPLDTMAVTKTFKVK